MVNDTQGIGGMDGVAEMEVIKVALSRVVVGLLEDKWDPGSIEGGAGWGGRPLWWWHVKLVEWAGGTSARRDYPHYELRGLRLSLRAWSDAELRTFLEGLADQAEMTLSA